MKSVCLAILNYNGRKHLEHLLPTACIAAKNFPGSCSALVLDNRSTDPDVEWIKREFPTVEVVVAPKNDFLFSYNWLAENRTEDVLIFLNNDLKLRPDLVAPLVRQFASKDVFAVSATSRDWEDQTFTCGPARLKQHHGLYYWDYDCGKQELSHTLFCSGGFMAVDRAKFLALGGFNRLFWPAYGEDLDLSFRAWRKGWRCIFEPASVVCHRENGSFCDARSNRSLWLMLRCQFLFQWSSLPVAASWLERSAIQLLNAWRHAFKGDFVWTRCWLNTWREWQRVRRQYRWMKTSAEELQQITRIIDAPVVSTEVVVY